MRVPALVLFGGLTLAACDLSTPEKDRPNPGVETPSVQAPATPGPAPNQALIDATPQVSLSEEQRAELRELAKRFIGQVGDDFTRGFTPVQGVEDSVVALQPSETHVWQIQLQRGETYRVIGACDVECTDMDLQLLDPSGKIIERDTLPDSFPVLNVPTGAAGTYTVRFMMKTCTVAPCYAAARLYHQTGSTAEPAEDDQAA